MDTVTELRTRNADNLYARINEVASEHSVQRTPALEEVQDWIAQAKGLDRALFY